MRHPRASARNAKATRSDTPHESYADWMAKREARLPQWAQKELSRLRADTTRAKEKLRNVLGEDPTDIEVSKPYRDGEPHTFLPESTRLTYHFGKHTEIEISLTEQGVEIMANGGCLGLQPHSANVAHAFVIERG